MGYFIAHFMGNDLFNPQNNSRWFVVAAITLSVFSFLTSSLAVLQARRMKDKRAEEQKFFNESETG